MEIKSCITRKPVSDLSRFKGLLILARINMNKIRAIENPENDIPFVLQTIAQIDKAAKCLGFSNFNDMIEYTKMFGLDSL